MNTFKACFFDIDGTLVRSDHSISQPVIEAVQRLEREGVAPIIATGRSYEALMPIKKKLGINSPVICYNGAMIVDGKNNSIIKHHTLPEKEAREVIQLARKLDYHILAYREGELIYEKERPEVDEYYNRVKLSGTIVNFDDLNELKLTKFLIIAQHEKLLPLKDEILGKYGDKLNAFNSDPRFLEIVPAGIDKAQAVIEVMSLLGGTVDQSMAMGDGFNDLPMLETVHWGVVMANALPDLRGKFPLERTAPHCDIDGVALYLTGFFGWDSQAKVVSLSSSPERGTSKYPVKIGNFIKDFGMEGDGHAGKWHRQVCIFDVSSLDSLTEAEKAACEESFSENITTRGIEISRLPIGTILKIGQTILKITQIGKDFVKDPSEHTPREVIMHKEGVFSIVLESGKVEIGDSISVLKVNGNKV